jgi:hypothetical protein
VTFVVATAVDPFFQSPHFPGSGSVGFGFKGASSFGGNSWLVDVTTSGAFVGAGSFGGPSGTIGLSLGAVPEFVFGGTDTSRIAGNLIYTKVVEGAVRIL